MTQDFCVRRVLVVMGVVVALAFAAPRLLTHTPYPRLGVSLTLDARAGPWVGATPG